MDDTSFKAGMEMLEVLPSQSSINPKARYRVYAKEFAGDDGGLFVAACRLGLNTAWRFFPVPSEIRDSMKLITTARASDERQAENALRVARALEHASAEVERRECENDDCGLCLDERRLTGPRRPLALPPPNRPSRRDLADAQALVNRARRVLAEQGEQDDPQQRRKLARNGPEPLGAIIDLDSRRRRPTSNGDIA